MYYSTTAHNHYPIASTSTGYENPMARVLTPEEIEAHFPRTIAEQAHVQELLAHHAEAQRERLARKIGSGAIMLALSQERVTRVAQEFHGLVVATVSAHDLLEQASSISCRPKGADRTHQKAVVYHHEAKREGRQPYPILDMVAGQTIVPTASCVELDQKVKHIKDSLALPDIFPSGQRSIEVGASDNPNSAHNFPVRKLIVPFWHEETVHIGEWRIWNAEEQVIDAESRSGYLVKREQEYQRIVGISL